MWDTSKHWKLVKIEREAEGTESPGVLKGEEKVLLPGGVSLSLCGLTLFVFLLPIDLSGYLH